ncbi:salicylic acid-binding protein 2 [Ziziphus jujuba]|nr:salicylic acid-binding protein 2 [Ziziphus jujuba]
MEATKEKHHYVLIHGICHGAWCWYKIIPLLKSAGHWVTALDLAASGVNKRSIEDLHTFVDYSQPLLEFMESIPQDERVILVGHSFGGMNLALAMEKFPEKISVAVFLTAIVPDTVHPPSYVIEAQNNRTNSGDGWLDTVFTSYGSPDKPSTSMLFGPMGLSSKLYQLSPIQDLELAKTLIRPGFLFIEDLSKVNKFTNSRYGSVTRVFIVCDEDEALTEEFQRWMIENSGTNNVMEIHGADHMAMLSKPQQLFHSLLDIAHHYT